MDCSVCEYYCIMPIFGCIFLSSMYVLSLYVWHDTHLRNNPSVIKKRFLSVTVTSILSPFGVYIFSITDLPYKHNIFDLLGFRWPGIFMAATIPLLLTIILFLGPLTMQCHIDNCQLYSEAPEQKVQLAEMPHTSSISVPIPFTLEDDNSLPLESYNSSDNNVQFTNIHTSDMSVEEKRAVGSETSECPGSSEKIKVNVSRLTEECNVSLKDIQPSHVLNDSERKYWIHNCKDLIWLRDHIVAPFSEELTFRACMLPLLIQCFRPQTAVFICPLFFGIAHFHHAIGRVKTGYKIKTAILLAGFQFFFTTIFGAYSAFLFLRTGHFIAPFLAHAFCNHLGFPNFREIWTYNEPKRSMTFSLCVIGLVSWCGLLSPLTIPSWYKNTIYWKT